MDTKRSLSDLEILYADNNSGSIGAQDLRDGFKSTFGSQTVSAFNDDFTLTRDDIHCIVDTSSKTIFATLPNISASDGSGDTYRNKIYTFNNTGNNDLYIVPTPPDLLFGTKSLVKVDSKSGLSIVGVSSTSSSWQATSFFNENVFSGASVETPTLYDIGKASTTDRDQTFVVNSGTSASFVDSTSASKLSIHNEGISIFGTETFDLLSTEPSGNPSYGKIWVSADNYPYYTSADGSHQNIIIGDQNSYNVIGGAALLQTTSVASCTGTFVITDTPFFVLLNVGNLDCLINTIRIATEASSPPAVKSYQAAIYDFDVTTTAPRLVQGSVSVSHATNETMKFTDISISELTLKANTPYYVGLNGSAGADVKIFYGQGYQNSPLTTWNLAAQAGFPATIPAGSVPAGRQLSSRLFWMQLTYI